MPFLSALPTVDPQSVVDGAKLWSGPGYIDGLQMQWVSATAVTVSSGRAYIPSLGYYLDAPNAIALTGLALTASTFYHLYLYNNAGTPAIECVTTAPAAPYSGTARAKTGDTSRRYVGSVKTDSSGNIFNFTMNGLCVSYYADVGEGVAPFRLLQAGVATTNTTVSALALVPITSKLMLLRAFNFDTGAPARFLNSESGLSVPACLLSISADVGGVATNAFVDFPLDSSQAFEYFMNGTPSGAGCYADCLGYTYQR